MDRSQILEALNQAYFSEDPHEKEVLDHLPEVLRSAKVFVDLGASLGQYTFHANKHMRGGVIYAIEADPVRFSELESNCRGWERLSNNTLHAIHAAVSDCDGTTEFHVTNSSVSGGLFRHDLLHVADDVRQTIRWETVVVKCARLDIILKGRKADLVKIDVEGSELRVLKGCTDILKLGQTKFLVELHDWADPGGQQSASEVRKFMERFVYHPTPFYGKTLFVKRTRLQSLILWGKRKARRLLRGG